MNLVEIQLGQAVRFMPLAGTQGSLYGPNLARAFEQRYGFLQGPRTVEEWNISNKGVSFLHGLFEGSLIAKFSIFEDGLVCETQVNTDVADAFIDDAIKWAREEAGYQISSSSTSRAYISRINVQSPVALDKVVDGFEVFGSGLAAAVRSYGRHNPPPYVPAALHFHVENGKDGSPPFLFERTLNQPYSTGRYYSSAPLRTDDHLHLLGELEKALAR